MPDSTTETRTYVGITGGPSRFVGYADLIFGKSYTGTLLSDGSVAIVLLNGQTTSVTAKQWEKWFRK